MESLNAVWSRIALAGKSFKEIGFPEEWEYNIETCCYEKDGFDRECDGEVTREKYVLPKKLIAESMR